MGLLSRLKSAIRIIIKGNDQPLIDSSTSKIKTSSEYWTSHNVTLHKIFTTKEESLAYMRWRFDQYLPYESLMSCVGYDNKVILDYGCGPGHDVIGFGEYSKPKKIIAMDVSSTSLEETRKRAQLHKISSITEIKLIRESEKIPLEENSIDYIHASGVLHHTPNLHEILMEFYRILKSDGIIKIMVYNRDSIWVHLYVPYILQIKQGIYKNLDLKEAFKRSTDGKHCPISNNYTPGEFIKICDEAGFTSKYLGAAISLDELDWVLERNKAMKDIRLSEKHRNFLKKITFNENGFPLYNGNVAGIDAVFELKKNRI
ncbi:MAG: class I SAM-dependent methyltransferase [Saprospiraceae bacterium]|jgi:ubiquinone/menaquinone biosynthesis C-methylase UbiE|nr:class I SAM-dependent methyltransferase [Saprospiraceae bacterium]